MPKGINVNAWCVGSLWSPLTFFDFSERHHECSIVMISCQLVVLYIQGKKGYYSLFLSLIQRKKVFQREKIKVMKFHYLLNNRSPPISLTTWEKFNYRLDECGAKSFVFIFLKEVFFSWEKYGNRKAFSKF